MASRKWWSGLWGEQVLGVPVLLCHSPPVPSLGPALGEQGWVEQGSPRTVAHQTRVAFRDPWGGSLFCPRENHGLTRGA